MESASLKSIFSSFRIVFSYFFNQKSTAMTSHAPNQNQAQLNALMIGSP